MYATGIQGSPRSEERLVQEDGVPAKERVYVGSSYGTEVCPSGLFRVGQK